MKTKTFRSLSLAIVLATTLVACNKNNEEIVSSNNNAIEEVQEKPDEVIMPTLFIDNKELKVTNEILATKDNFLLPYNDIAKQLNTELKILDEKQYNSEILKLIEITYLDESLAPDGPYIEYFYPEYNLSFTTYMRDVMSIYHKDKTQIINDITYIPIDYLRLYYYYFDEDNNKLHLISNIEDNNIDNELRYKAILNTYQKQYNNFITAVNTLSNDLLLGLNPSVGFTPMELANFYALANGIDALSYENKSPLDYVNTENINKDLLNTYIVKYDEFYNKALDLATKSDEYFFNNQSQQIDEKGNQLVKEIKSVMNASYEEVLNAYIDLIN